MSISNQRLRQHPQAKSILECTERWVFDCAGCGHNFYLSAAVTQPDGTLLCRLCSDVADTRRFALVWCPGCKRSFPREQFVRLLKQWTTGMTEEKVREMRASRANEYWTTYEMLCEECRATPPEPKPTRECERCGNEFTPGRSDARFCSGRCRVAHHRARGQSGD
jgi:hypothetical protein